MKRISPRAGTIRAVLAAAMVVVIVALLAGRCGLPRDTAPEEVSIDALPQSIRPGQLPTPVEIDGDLDGETSSNQVFLIDGNQTRLVGVERAVATTPQEIINELLLGATREEKLANIDSEITRGTEVQNVDVNELFLVATVDLGADSLDPRRSEQRLAFAQIVWSLTSLDDIETVQFVQSDPDDPDADAISLPVQTDAGTTLPGQRVGREDFLQLAPNITARPPVIAFPATVPTPDPSLIDQIVWKVSDTGQLLPVNRQIRERTNEAVLRALIDGTSPGEAEQSIRSALPPDALADPPETITVFDRTITPDGTENVDIIGIAKINFEAASLPRPDDGDELLLAVAQIVYTMTELGEIDRVAITVEGQSIPIPTQDGRSVTFNPEDPDGVSRQDYDSLVAPDFSDPGPATLPEPSPTPG